MERDEYTHKWITWLATATTIEDLVNRNVPNEIISEIGHDLVCLASNKNIHHTSIHDFLRLYSSTKNGTLLIDAIFFDYMCTFEGANVDQKYSGTVNNPKRDIEFLLSHLPVNHEFVIALTFCVSRGTPSGVTPEMAIKSENEQMNQIFADNDIGLIEYVMDTEEDSAGWEYVQEGGKVHMHFTCYRGYKMDVIEID